MRKPQIFSAAVLQINEGFIATKKNALGYLYFFLLKCKAKCLETLEGGKRPCYLYSY